MPSHTMGACRAPAGLGMHNVDTALGNTWGWLSSCSALKERVNVGKMFASAEEGSRKAGEVMLEGKELPLHLSLQKAVLEGMSLFSLWSCYGCGAAFTSPGASHVCLCLCFRLLPWATAWFACVTAGLTCHLPLPIPGDAASCSALFQGNIVQS